MKPILTLALLAAVAGGCRSDSASSLSAGNASLRPLVIPSGAAAADADRAALARFVGDWTFEGWTHQSGEALQQRSGRAAAAIEYDHFVHFDVRANAGQSGGQSVRTAGSMLLASEPGVGVTLSAWGDASPSVSRFVGHAHKQGAEWTFTEASVPAGRHRLEAVMAFESDDRWVMEIRDSDEPNRPTVARYTFTRSAT